jgi:hypothetical protein
VLSFQLSCFRAVISCLYLTVAARKWFA